VNKQSVALPGAQGSWGSYVSKYQPDSNKVLDNMFTTGSKNFVTDQTGMIQKRQGGVQWNRTSFAQVAKDTYEAVFESGARHFLRVGGGILSASTGTGLFDTITGGYTAIGNFEWATYQNRIYGCNGINSPQTYDIATSYGGVPYSFTTGKTKVMGAQIPISAPTAGAPTTGGAVPNGAHTYKVTYLYYDAEESNGSSASSVQTAGSGNNTIPLTAIPIGGYGVTARNIYRDNNDGVYLLLDTVADNTTTSYSDVLLIGSTPTPIPQYNNVPPTFNKIALWLDSLFIAPSGETNTVRFSNSGDPDIFDPGNSVTCQSDDIITALYVYNGKLYVFGLHSFGCIEGNTPDTFYYHNISNLIGCVDNRSIQVRSIVSVPTLWWLSDKGLYYSNGNTVEYGSDFIQDLVNLNLAQVNYSIGKNTQTSLTDFAGDTSSPGIDIATNPGSVMTINPKKSYSTNADWLGGSSLTNCKTSNGDLLEVPTQSAPALASGVLGGSAQISGNNIILTTFSGAMGEAITEPYGTLPPTTAYLSIGTLVIISGYAKKFVIGQTSTLTSMNLWKATSGTVGVWNDSFGSPGAQLFSQSVGSGVGVATVSPNITVYAGSTYWIGIIYTARAHVPMGSFLSAASSIYKSAFWNGSSWTFSFVTNQSTMISCTPGSYALAPVPASGTWTSPIYDSGSTTAISTAIIESGTYPTGCSGSITVYASTSPSMSGAISQTFSNPNGINSLSLTNYRYWQIVSSLATINNTVTPTMGSPILKFSITAEWISQPIDTTIDKTAWGTLTYSGNVPLDTSVNLTIATSTSSGSGYSSYGPIESALNQQWAKVKVVLTTNTDNIVSPSISSVTLTWNITSSITSNIIDTGTTPSGFNIFQWEQIAAGAGTTFYIKTAASSGGIPGASFVSVANGEFPALSALQYVQWKAILSSTADVVPEITSITVSWYISSGTSGVRCSSIFYNKTYYLTVATIGATANDTIIQLDQFGNWRVQKDTSVGTFLSYFNTLYFTDGINGSIFNGFIADTDNGTAIAMDVRTKAWNADNDLFLKLPRAFKVTGLHTNTTIRTYYSVDRGQTWIEMLNENGSLGYATNGSGTEFVVLFVPNAITLVSGRTLMYRLTSTDMHPCSIINYVPSFYSRRGRFLHNG
jgi:hypothetical protein